MRQRNCLVLSAALTIALAVAGRAAAALQFSIDIDTLNDTGTTTNGAIDTAPGWTSLDATQPSNGDSVTISGVSFSMMSTVFSATGSRYRSGPNSLTRDLLYDTGGGAAVGLLIDGLPDGEWKVEVWSWDQDFPTGDQIVGITEFASAPETIYTTSFAPSPTDPFTFYLNTDDLTLRDGFGIFTRENNSQNGARFNALRLTQVVPEPVTASLALLTLGGLGVASRRRRA